MKKTFKFFIFILFLLTLYILISAYSYVEFISNNLSDNVFRLHIIANSNSKEDQNLKYIVRDKIIEYMREININSKSKGEILETAYNNLNNFVELTNTTIKENGFNYTSTAEIGNFKFPTKTYSDINFPSGYYDALEIKLGKSQGENWWCVLYPSLCVFDLNELDFSEDSKKTLENTLSDESYKLISKTNNSTPIYLKFKIIELFNKIVVKS